ncbi:MAG: 6,7-dimethyl-8-ribityllumazine synthase [Acidobacteriota bacterium]
MNVVEGGIEAQGKKFCIVVSQFNKTITQKLLDGALDCLRKHGASEDMITVVWCPGAFEIPQVASRVTLESRFDAVICLGAVIRGETPHFDYICQEAARGVGEVSRTRSLPVLFGVLTTDTFEQASERAGGAMGNKGWDAALGAIAMSDVFTTIATRNGRG